jgi:regulator of protease activity HflC (stomatin/prohibitin superfamily)
MTLGEFFQQVIEWLYELWPIRIVREWEQGVRLRAGNVTRLLTSTNGWFGTGIHAFLPLVGEIQSEETNQRVIETSWQTLTTLDGVSVSFSIAARYQIRDLAKLYVSVHDPEETIQNQLSAAAEVLDSIVAENVAAEFAPAIHDEAKKRLTEWGVKLLQVSLFNRVEATSLRLLAD